MPHVHINWLMLTSIIVHLPRFVRSLPAVEIHLTGKAGDPITFDGADASLRGVAVGQVVETSLRHCLRYGPPTHVYIIQTDLNKVM